jgi:hypothetical protein
MLARPVADQADGNPLFVAEIADLPPERGAKRSPKKDRLQPAAVTAALRDGDGQQPDVQLASLRPSASAVVAAATASYREATNGGAN